MKRVTAAIIGTGFMGRVHLEAVRRLGFVDVVAVAGSDAAKARSLADAFGVEHATADYRTVLANPGVDAVHICTPNVRHHAMAAGALDAGKQVICEKPLAMTSAEAADLVSRASASGLRTALCHNLRYYPDGAANAPDVRGRRARRHSDRTGHVFAGLAAVRVGLELAR